MNHVLLAMHRPELKIKGFQAHMPTSWRSNFHRRYTADTLPMFTKDSHKAGQSSIIYNSPFLETVHMSIKSKWISKLWLGHTLEYYTAKKMKVLL